MYAYLILSRAFYIQTFLAGSGGLDPLLCCSRLSLSERERERERERMERSVLSFSYPFLAATVWCDDAGGGLWSVERKNGLACRRLKRARIARSGAWRRQAIFFGSCPRGHG